MKAAVVFHSVCGNGYLLAKMFEKAFAAAGADVCLRRVKDDDFENWREMFPSAARYADEISNTPVASIKDLTDADVAVLGCPTYFGTVSAEMKAFLDSTVAIFTSCALAGTKAPFFTSAGSVGGGGAFCLETLVRFAQHTGMIPMPVPQRIQAMTPCAMAYGFCHVAGDFADIRPDENTQKAINAYAASLTARA